MNQKKNKTFNPSFPPSPYDVVVLVLFGSVLTSAILINLGVKVTSHIFAPRAYIRNTFLAGRATLRTVIAILNNPPPISNIEWLGTTRQIGWVSSVAGPMVAITLDPTISHKVSLSHEIFILGSRGDYVVPCQVQQRLGQRSLVRILSCMLRLKEGKVRVVALDSTDKIQPGDEVRGIYVAVPAGKPGLWWVVLDIINGFRKKRGTTWSMKNFKEKWVKSWKIEKGNSEKF